MPDIPAPPMPTKWIRRIRPISGTRYAATSVTLAALQLQAQHESDHRAAHDEAVAAVTDEWEREALGRQHTGVDPEVDEALDADHQADPVREVAAEIVAFEQRGPA